MTGAGDALAWAKALVAIAQTGLAYARDPFDVERYAAVRRIAAEMLTRGSGVAPERIDELLRGDVGHATPKVDVRGVVFREGAILLVRERGDGRWTLPGGWADVGESPSAAVEREISEESGYRTRATKLLALFDRDTPRHGHAPHPHHVYKLFFRCELLDEGTATLPENAETDGVAFFRPDALPPLSLGRVTPGQVAHFFAHEAHPEWPTDFD